MSIDFNPALKISHKVSEPFRVKSTTTGYTINPYLSITKYIVLNKSKNQGNCFLPRIVKIILAILRYMTLRKRPKILKVLHYLHLTWVDTQRLFQHLDCLFLVTHFKVKTSEGIVNQR